MSRLYMQGVTHSSKYASLRLYTRHQCLNMPQYVLIFLNIREHGRILLNVPENSCSDYVRVLNMP